MDSAERYYSAPRVLLRQAAQLVYPRRCPFCHRVLGFVQDCPDCADEVQALENGPVRRLSEETYCLAGLEGAASAYLYEGIVRRAVLRSKYEGEAWVAVQLGCRMAELLYGGQTQVKLGVELPQKIESFGMGYDLIVPVPASHKERGYNVPGLMARPLARALGVPLDEGALRRIHPGRPQAGRSRAERFANVAGAFDVPEASSVEGKRILLVDDVITTGATVTACTQALLYAGADSVFAVSLAATPPPDKGSSD